MGGAYSTIYKEGTLPYTIPKCDSKPTFDPQLGFHPHRKERDPKMSKDEMRALKIPVEQQDYCAYFLKEVYMCKRDNKPFYLTCKSSVHNYKQCLLDDYILRMKEFERERRLRLRKMKLEEMGMAA